MTPIFAIVEILQICFSFKLKVLVLTLVNVLIGNW